MSIYIVFFFFSSRRRHTRWTGDWSSDVCSSDLTEGVPVLDMARVENYLRGKPIALVGPNCPGLISPGKANVGIIPGEISSAGPVGLVSRSGTLTYQVMYEMAEAGVGQTTCVG